MFAYLVDVSANRPTQNLLKSPSVIRQKEQILDGVKKTDKPLHHGGHNDEYDLKE